MDVEVTMDVDGGDWGPFEYDAQKDMWVRVFNNPLEKRVYHFAEEVIEQTVSVLLYDLLPWEEHNVEPNARRSPSPPAAHEARV